MSVLRLFAGRFSAARLGVAALACAGVVGLAMSFAVQRSAAANQNEGAANAKEKAAPTETEKPAPAAADGEDFDAIYGQMQQLIEDLNDLKSKYAQAKEADRAAIQQEFREKSIAGQAIYPKLLPAAEKAFAAKPDMTGNPAKFLIDHMTTSISGNTWEPKSVERITKMMLSKLPDNSEVLCAAGCLSMNQGDDKKAMEQLNKAAKNGKLSENAEKALTELKIREKEAKADDLPRVKLQTSKGDIVIELFENEAPNSVANYISLIEKKFYDGLTFHRVIDGFMAQGGDPTGDGSGGPGYAIACECYSKNYRTHFRGTLSMAHAGKDTGGSQFFLCFTQTTHLDGRHTAFGRIVEGLDVLDKLTRIQPGEPGTPDKIVKATVVRKREHEYAPKKLANPRG
jgi:cyclophilin family peptidyl-prolyl cis-trans isomerase